MKQPCNLLRLTLLSAICAWAVCDIAAAQDAVGMESHLGHSGQVRAVPERASQNNKTIDYDALAKNSPKLRDYRPAVQKDLLPLEWKTVEDAIVASNTDPALKLRKLTGHFWSQKVGGVRWGHPCTVFMPADMTVNETASRKGKIVIFGAPPLEQYDMAIAKYGEPIAARTKYPTMVFSNPGVASDGRNIEGCIGDLLSRAAEESGKQPYYNMNYQCATCYVRAIDAMAELLGNKDLHAIVGGHSKRGRGALVAAAIDPRVASAVEMGNEGVPRTDSPNPNLLYHYFKDQIHVPIFYIGATNEDGYAAFNINTIKGRCAI